MELKDTIPMMESDDYKERFNAEYNQLNIRLKKLSEFITKYENEELNFIPSCPIKVLKGQLANMWGYRSSLIRRAEIEGIELIIG